MRHVSPSTCSIALSADTRVARLPITTPSSASWWISPTFGGIRIASPGPMTAVEGFMNMSGSDGSGLFISAA